MPGLTPVPNGLVAIWQQSDDGYKTSSLPFNFIKSTSAFTR